MALAPEDLVLEVIIKLNKSGWQAPLLCMQVMPVLRNSLGP